MSSMGLELFDPDRAHDYFDRLEKSESDLAKAREEVKAFRDALDPDKTKCAYIGEQSFNEEIWVSNGEDGDYEMIDVIVPWTTTKDIMKMILDRAEQAKKAKAEGKS